MAIAGAFLFIIPSTASATRSSPPLGETDFVVSDVRESMTPADIQKTLGPPESIVRKPDPLDSGAEMINWRYAGLEVALADEASIRGIILTDARVATARGLRVGDKTSRVKKLYGKPSNKYKSAWDYEAPDHELHVIRVNVEAGRVQWIYLGWLHD